MMFAKSAKHDKTVSLAYHRVYFHYREALHYVHFRTVVYF